MDWVNARDESTDLMTELAPPSHNAVQDFSPLATGLLAPLPNITSATDWPVPEAARDNRHDFRYEFSLSAGPEFDTGSAHDELEAHDEDDVSTHLHATISTSEDTSVTPQSATKPQQSKHHNPSVAGTQAKQPAPSTTTPIVSASLPLASAAALSVTAPLSSVCPSTSGSVSVSASASAGTGSTVGRYSAVPIAPKTESIADGSVGPHKRVPTVDISNLATTPSMANSSKQSNDTMTAGSAKISPRKAGKAIVKKKPGGKKVSTSSMTPASSSMTLSAGTSTPASGGLSHTKLCRDRLNNMFERLRHTLPPAPPGVEVKHKAQVLDYAIMELKKMVDRTSQLEVELAVSSNKATMDWICKLVDRIDSFPQAAEEVMRLFSKRRGWLHAELWTVEMRPGHKGNTALEEGVALKLCRAVGNDMNGSSSLLGFSKESSCMTFGANEGVQGRVWSSMRPEWVTGVSDLKNFRRSELARKFGVKVCLAVPITITGKIEGVMCFYDVRHRPYDTQCLELAMRLAWALGNAIGGKRAKIHYGSTSGTGDS